MANTHRESITVDSISAYSLFHSGGASWEEEPCQLRVGAKGVNICINDSNAGGERRSSPEKCQGFAGTFESGVCLYDGAGAGRMERSGGGKGDTKPGSNVNPGSPLDLLFTFLV